MTLYTILPLEQVLNGFDKQPEFTEMKWQGRTLLVQHVDQQTVRIERLVQCSHLDDFLDPNWMPGALLQTQSIFN
ncbi:YlzJ-like family protein [Paenibacillus sp. 481]|uniref:YlzJ-like family protein n=1 Tax=Paenibacillus sp. 481 TaxID=2835869 RepID=UPI001E478F2D|nr:YlzJ-like family protein [Paenibacillus sp. 481]UHA73879.1 YlzJ-like family protein [Paenibacillus sp. 481]